MRSPDTRGMPRDIQRENRGSGTWIFGAPAYASAAHAMAHAAALNLRQTPDKLPRVQLCVIAWLIDAGPV